jgi:hypothetical protein
MASAQGSAHTGTIPAVEVSEAADEPSDVPPYLGGGEEHLQISAAEASQEPTTEQPPADPSAETPDKRATRSRSRSDAREEEATETPSEEPGLSHAPSEAPAAGYDSFTVLLLFIHYVLCCVHI